MPPYGLPRDLAQWLALALALAMIAIGPRLVRPTARRGVFAALAALASASLSAAYVVAYLRGGPRIIDATSYYLEARALARGFLAWPLSSPETAEMGRFLVRSTGNDGARAATRQHVLLPTHAQAKTRHAESTRPARPLPTKSDVFR